MSSQVLEELRSFHEFIGQKLQHSEEALSPEEALDEWRFLHSEPDDYEAIKEALDAGDTGRPFEEFAAEFRRRHHIPAQPSALPMIPNPVLYWHEPTAVR